MTLSHQMKSCAPWYFVLFSIWKPSSRRLHQKLTELKVIITDVAFLNVLQLTSMTSSFTWLLSRQRCCWKPELPLRLERDTEIYFIRCIFLNIVRFFLLFFKNGVQWRLLCKCATGFLFLYKWLHAKTNLSANYPIGFKPTLSFAPEVKDQNQNVKVKWNYLILRDLYIKTKIQFFLSFSGLCTRIV